MFLGIPHLIVLLVLVAPFAVIGGPALAAAFSWPSSSRRIARPVVFFRAQPAGGAW